MPGEVCDDGDTNALSGCLGDCTGAVPGWLCTGGSMSTAQTCV
ncbi:MAG: hypothetical protein IPK55_12595 [Streptococcus sp.]|nr:hypothetical protein [Streptococcus sp.]